MAALAGLMGASMAQSAFTSASSAYAQSQAIRMQADYSKNVSDSNAKLSDVAARDAIARGETSARLSLQRTREEIGDSRARLAASGVDVNSGSAADVQKSEAAVGALDAMTIRNNAAREALGYKVQALNFTSKGQFAELSAANESRNTLLTGGMNALGYGTRSAYYFGK